MTEFSMLNGFL